MNSDEERVSWQPSTTPDVPLPVAAVVLARPEVFELATFTAHNIHLGNGRWTKPDMPAVETSAKFRAAQQVLQLAFQGDRTGLKLVDVGCLEGGYSVGFARMGFDVLGLEVRDYHFKRCEYVRRKLGLSNLRFVHDDVMNVDKHGDFDAAFCSGILHHLDTPVEFLTRLAAKVKKLLVIDTHFSVAEPSKCKVRLGELDLHEGVEGRWFNGAAEAGRDDKRKSQSAKKYTSAFWIRREQLLELLYVLGFQTVFEQFDSMAPNISQHLDVEYPQLQRGTFIGVRESCLAEPHAP